MITFPRCCFSLSKPPFLPSLVSSTQTYKSKHHPPNTDTSSLGVVALKHMHTVFDISTARGRVKFSSLWLWVGLSDLLKVMQPDCWGWVIKADTASAWLWLANEPCPFRALGHPVIRLTTVKPPCWRDQMEKTQRWEVPVELQHFPFQLFKSS